MLDEYLSFYTVYVDALDHMDDETALEGFQEVAATLMRGTEKLAIITKDVIVKFFEQLLANIIVIASNLKGYYISQKSEFLMREMIRTFNELVDMCLYDQDKVFQGLTEADRKKQVKIYNTMAWVETPVLDRRIKLDRARQLLEKHKAELSTLDYKKDAISYTQSVALQRDMLQLTNKIRALNKKTTVLLSTRVRANAYGMGKVIDYLLDVNKSDLAQMGAMIAEAYSLVRVKPLSGATGADTPQAIAANVMNSIEDKGSRSTQKMIAKNGKKNGVAVTHF